MNGFVLVGGGALLWVYGLLLKYKGRHPDGQAGRFTMNGCILIILGLGWVLG